MDWKNFYSEIRSGNINGIYLFAGPEELVKREALDRLKIALLPNGAENFDYSILDTPKISDVIDASEQFPMISERRLVVAVDWAPLLSGKARNEADETDALLTWLENPPDTAVIVFLVRGDPDMRKKSASALKDRLVRFDYLSEGDIIKWINSKLKTHEKSMDTPTASHLVFCAGRELYGIKNELDKLIAYTGNRKSICIDDINEIVTPSVEYRVYSMMDNLLSGRADEAIKAFNYALESGFNRIGILAVMLRQLRNMSRLKLASQVGKSPYDEGKRLGLSQYAVKNTLAQSGRLSSVNLTELYLQAIDYDFAIKSGRLRDEDALDNLMRKILTKK